MVDSLVTLICPACGKEMKKVYVKECDKVVDICSNGCGGIFFDNQELKHFDEENESIIDIIEPLEGKYFEPTDTTKIRTCPVCKIPMIKNLFNEVQIDECYTCGGKFLDNGELERIRKNFATEEDSTKKVLDNFNDSFRANILAQDYELEQLRKNRSPLKKFFDTYIWKV